jgi:hypothetical protein
MKAVDNMSSSLENEIFWRHHYTQLKTSNLSRVNYCNQHHVNYDRFGYWLGKFSKKEKVLIPVKVIPLPESPTPEASSQVLCTLSFKNGMNLNIHTLDALSYILAKMD